MVEKLHNISMLVISFQNIFDLNILETNFLAVFAHIYIFNFHK